MSESTNNDLVRVSDVVAILQFERAKWEKSENEIGDLASICATGAISNCLAVVMGARIDGYPKVEVVTRFREPREIAQ